MKRLIGFCLGMLLVLPAWADEDPLAMIKTTAEQVLTEVTAHKAELEKDSGGLYALVQQYIVPHADFYRMAQIAMGRYWRRADDAQRQRIADEFRKMLVRTYATSLLNYSGQQIEYLPLRAQPDDTEVVVATRINLDTGGRPVPINYRVYKAADGWKIYDVIIDGVSLVANYRSSFASSIRRGGVEGLIQQLAENNAKMAK